MNKHDRERHYRLAMLLDGDFAAVDQLHRINARLHTLSERSCNGAGWYSSTWNNRDEARYWTSWTNAQDKARKILAGYGFTDYEEQGDPRGWGMFEAKNPATGQTLRINY